MNISHHATRPRALRGFTLLELMISVAILAILLGAAMPSFASILGSNRTTQHSNTLLQTLILARNRAVAEGKLVQVCQLGEGFEHHCEDNYSSYRSWQAGWMVFFDNNANNNYDEKDEIIRVEAGTHATTLLFNQRGRLRFFPNGRARSAGFTVCDSNRSHYRHIYLLHTGRARISQKTNEKQRQKCDAIAEQNRH